MVGIPCNVGFVLIDSQMKSRSFSPSSYLGFLVLAFIAGSVRWIFFATSGTMPDPDHYGRFAQAFADGLAGPAGYPSAFRAPLYPLMLAPLFLGDFPLVHVIACVHALLGGATAILVVQLGRQLDLPMGYALFAGLLTALNPQLIALSSQIMTETLFTLLLVGMLLLWSRQRWIFSGLVAGLGVLTRPTMLFLWMGLGAVSMFQPRQRTPWLLATVVSGAVCLPWVIRNTVLLGRPILGTTHGGYTWWLGMNESFYQTEVLGGRNWAFDVEFDRWQQRNQEAARAALVQDSSTHPEIVRDQLFRNLAWSFMRDHPSESLATAWYHLRTFWSVLPRSGPELFRPVVAVFYSGLFLLALVGMARIRWHPDWQPLLVVVVVLTLIHVLLWSNMRLRAPIEPLLALWAARGIAPSAK
jgi:4-amino-4-deoxy-L-arabinose transferase-like glycosyltransferase